MRSQMKKRILQVMDRPDPTHLIVDLGFIQNVNPEMFKEVMDEIVRDIDDELGIVHLNKVG